MAGKRVVKRPKKKKGTSLPARVGKGLYGLVVFFSALVVLLWGVYQLSSRQPTTAQPPSQPWIPAATDDPSTDRDESKVPALVRKEMTWTFLLAAQDQVSSSTDTLMVCTYDTANQTMGLVSIPRDTLVDREGWRYHKLNAAYASGGIAELMDAVGEVLGFPLDHYVLIDTDIFVALVDAVDGIEFNVPVHMAYDDPAQDLHIHYEPGWQTLTGQQALEVVRCRKNSDGEGDYPHNLYDAYPDADIGRTRTQQEMLKAILKKVLSNPQKINSYVQLFADYVDTDLTLGNLLWFVQPALQFDLSSLTTATLPGDGTVTYAGITYCYALDVDKSLEIINACLDPYTTPITADMVKMLQG